MNKSLLILAAVTVSRCSLPCPAGVVANTLFAECRGESMAGQKAVASVIWNRAGGNPEKLESVCLARKQFSCWNACYHPQKPRNAAESAILARFEGLESDMKAGNGKFKPSGAWTHYYAPAKCSPKWAAKLKNVQDIGSHRFGNCR